MTIDWDQTTNAERKCLNAATKALRSRLNIDWQTVFQRAFGLDDQVGDGYQDNLRKGAIAPGKAYKLYTWLYHHDRALADQVESQIFALRAATAPEAPPLWESLIKRGRFANIRTIKAQSSLGIVDFARREPIDPTALKLFDEFIFEIDAPLAGEVMAFQGYGGQWYPLPLSTVAPTVNVQQGKALLPVDDDGRPEPLREEARPGRYRFMFVIVKGDRLPDLATLQPHQPIPTRIRDDIARAVMSAPASDWVVLRTNLVFKQS